ncbi:MAG: aromatic aminobenezylarsenical efflux permease ArsG family transporter [Rikenellaceae bacterium]
MSLDYVTSLIESGSMPFVVAILLGVISAVSPCPLTTNISALGYIAKNIGNSRRLIIDGLLYAFGRIITYTLLGGISIFILRQGLSIAPINNFLNEYGESILPPVLLFMALVTLNVFHFHHHKHTEVEDEKRVSKYSKNGSGALLMGIVFALAFCPINGMFFFGMLAPMSAKAAGGYFMPLVYGLITGLPVVIITSLLAFSVGHIDGLRDRMAVIEKWCRIVVAAMLFLFALYFAYHAYIENDGSCPGHHHHDHNHTEVCE